MAVLSVQNLDMEFGERTLFSGVSFEVGERDKIGFIGSNATGKTTLFKLITGELEPSFYKRVDNALYTSKENGKNRITIFDANGTAKPLTMQETGDW